MIDMHDLEWTVSVTWRLFAQLVEKLFHLIGRLASLSFFELLIPRSTLDIPAHRSITRRWQAAAFAFLQQLGPDGEARRLAFVLVFLADILFHQLACFFRYSRSSIARKFDLRQKPRVSTLVERFSLTHVGFPPLQGANRHTQFRIPSIGSVNREDCVTPVGFTQIGGACTRQELFDCFDIRFRLGQSSADYLRRALGN